MVYLKIHPFFLLGYRNKHLELSCTSFILVPELIIYKITQYYTVPLKCSIPARFQDMQIIYILFCKCILLGHVICQFTYF